MLLPYKHETLCEAGCDEAGRGCLAGPVFAAAVILPKNYINNLLNDSKKINEPLRYKLRSVIENDALAWSVAYLDNNFIDENNILNASIKAMQIAISNLKLKPEMLLIDGNRFKAYENIPFECVVKGDSKFMSIAAASILAKTYRDDFMKQIDKEYPQYGWAKNKGYPTSIHINAVNNFGVSEYHRKTFKVNKQLKIGF